MLSALHAMIGRHESKNLTESFSFLIFHMEKQMQHHEWEVLKLWVFINNLIPHVCDSFMPAGSSTKLQLWPFKTAINNIAFRPENIHHVPSRTTLCSSPTTAHLPTYTAKWAHPLHKDNPVQNSSNSSLHTGTEIRNNSLTDTLKFPHFDWKMEKHFSK